MHRCDSKLISGVVCCFVCLLFCCCFYVVECQGEFCGTSGVPSVLGGAAKLHYVGQPGEM